MNLEFNIRRLKFLEDVIRLENLALFRAQAEGGYVYYTYKIDAGVCTLTFYAGEEDLSGYVCTPGDTMIETVHGSVEMGNLKNGEIILSLSEQNIIQTTSRDYEGELVCIKPAFLPETKWTPEHPIKIRHEKIWRYPEKHAREWKEISTAWVRAKDLKPSFYNNWSEVIVPKENTSIPYVMDLTKYYSIKHKYAKTLKIDDALARIFGWYLSEGFPLTEKSRKRGGICFSFGKEEHEYINDCMNALDSLGFHSYKENRGSGTNVICCSYGLSKFLTEEFGHGALNKKIPQWLFKERKEIIRTFLDAVMKGDGHVGEICGNKYFVLGLSSLEAILGIQRLYRKIGIVFGIAKIKSSTTVCGRKIKHPHPSYLLSGFKEHKKYHYHEDDSCYYFPIRKIRKEFYKGKVYNLETEENIYLAPFLVHNCLSREGKILQSEEYQPGFIPVVDTEYDSVLDALFESTKKTTSKINI